MVEVSEVAGDVVVGVPVVPVAVVVDDVGGGGGGGFVVGRLVVVGGRLDVVRGGGGAGCLVVGTTLGVVVVADDPVEVSLLAGGICGCGDRSVYCDGTGNGSRVWSDGLSAGCSIAWAQATKPMVTTAAPIATAAVRGKRLGTGLAPLDAEQPAGRYQEASERVNSGTVPDCDRSRPDRGGQVANRGDVIRVQRGSCCVDTLLAHCWARQHLTWSPAGRQL